MTPEPKNDEAIAAGEESRGRRPEQNIAQNAPEDNGAASHFKDKDQRDVKISKVGEEYKRRPYWIEYDHRTSQGDNPGNTEPLVKNYFMQLVWLSLSIIRTIEEEVEKVKKEKKIGKDVKHLCTALYFMRGGKRTDDVIDINKFDALPGIVNGILQHLRDSYSIEVIEDPLAAHNQPKYSFTAKPILGHSDLELCAVYSWVGHLDKQCTVSFAVEGDNVKNKNDGNLKTLINNYYNKDWICTDKKRYAFDAFSAFVLTSEALLQMHTQKRRNAYVPDDWREHEIFWHLTEWESHSPGGKKIDYKALTAGEMLQSIGNACARSHLDHLMEPMMEVRKAYFTHLADNDLALPKVNELITYLDTYHSFQRGLLELDTADRGFSDAIRAPLANLSFSALDVLQNLDSKLKDLRIAPDRSAIDFSNDSNDKKDREEEYKNFKTRLFSSFGEAYERSLEDTVRLLPKDELNSPAAQIKLSRELADQAREGNKCEIMTPVLKPLPHQPMVLHAMHVMYRFLTGYALNNDTYSTPLYQQEARLTRMSIDYLAFSRVLRNLELRFFFCNTEYQLLLGACDPLNFCHAYPLGTEPLLTPLEVVRLTEKILQHKHKRRGRSNFRVLIVGNWDVRSLIYRGLYLADFFRKRLENEKKENAERQEIEFEIRSKTHVFTIMTSDLDEFYPDGIDPEDVKIKIMDEMLNGKTKKGMLEEAPDLMDYTEEKTIKALARDYSLFFMLDAEQVMLAPDTSMDNWDVFKGTLKSSSYENHTGLEMWQKPYKGMWEMRDVKEHEFARVYRYLGAKGENGGKISTGAVVYRPETLQRINCAVRECGQDRFEAYYYVLHSGDVHSDFARSLNCFEFERYDGRDVNMLHFVREGLINPTSGKPENDNCICLDAWQFLKAAQSKVYYILRRCMAVNNMLPDFKGDFDAEGKIAFIEAMKAYRIHLDYRLEDGKIRVEFSRVMNDSYRKYFKDEVYTDPDTGETCKKYKGFDVWLRDSLRYLLRALKNEELCGLMERVIKQTLLLPIYSRCETAEDVLIYTLLLNERWDETSRIQIDLDQLDEVHEPGDCEHATHRTMPDLNYYQKLIECCLGGDGIAWASLDDVETKNAALGGGDGAREMRKEALDKLNTKAWPLQRFYETIDFELNYLKNNG